MLDFELQLCFPNLTSVDQKRTEVLIILGAVTIWSLGVGF